MAEVQRVQQAGDYGSERWRPSFTPWSQDVNVVGAYSSHHASQDNGRDGGRAKRMEGRMETERKKL